MAETCVALCDWAAGAPEELSFSKGDVIALMAKGNDSGWWEGKIVKAAAGGTPLTPPPLGVSSSSQAAPLGREGRQGIFPNCFVTSNLNPNRKQTFLNKAVALFDLPARDSTCMPLQKYDVITVTREGRTGWWFGVNESRAQRRKDAALSLANSMKDVAAVDVPEERELLFPSNYVTCQLVRAAYEFQARSRHEVSMKPGDVLIVHRRWNDGWWEGSNIQSRRGGGGTTDVTGVGAALSPPSDRMSSSHPVLPPNHPKDGEGLDSLSLEEREYEARLALRAELAAAHKKESANTTTSASSAAPPTTVVRLHRGIFPSNYTVPNVPSLSPSLFCAKCRSIFQPGVTECRECMRAEEITRTMMQALNDHSRGLVDGPLDLFMYVDEDKGKGALLSAQDLRDISVRPRLGSLGMQNFSKPIDAAPAGGSAMAAVHAAAVTPSHVSNAPL